MKKVLIAIIIAVLMIGCEEIKTKDGNQLLVECFDGKDRVFSALTDEIKVDGDYLKFKVVETTKEAKQIEKVGLINFKCLVQEMTAEQIEQMKKAAAEATKPPEQPVTPPTPQKPIIVKKVPKTK